MGKITFVTVKDSKGTVKKQKGTIIVQNPIMITDFKKIGNTNKKSTKKVRRQVQYVDTLDTIFIDEQIEAMGGKIPDPTPVYITKGKKDVDDDDVALVKFLKIHSDNIENGGRIFKEYLVEKEDELEVEQFTFTSKVCAEIMESKDEIAYSIAVWFLSVKYLNMSVNKVKKSLYVRCQNDYEFTKMVAEFLKDQTKEHKLLITMALSNNIIIIRNGNKIAWADSQNSENLFIGSNPNDIVAEFSTYLKTDQEGRETLKLISKKVEEENK